MKKIFQIVFSILFLLMGTVVFAQTNNMQVHSGGRLFFHETFWKWIVSHLVLP